MKRSGQLLCICGMLLLTAPSLHADESVPVPDGSGDLILLSDSGNLLRRPPNATDRWSIMLGGTRFDVGGVRPPHLLADADRVYLTHSNGVTAVSTVNGARLWHSHGPKDRLFLSGKILLATECHVIESAANSGRWLVARNVTNGATVFRSGLPTKDFDPLAIQDAAGLLLVQAPDRPSGQGLSFLFNRDGSVHHRFDHYVADARSYAGGRLVLTGAEVIRLSAAGQVEWITPFQHYEWIAAGGLVPLEGGDMLAFKYSSISDSGVQVMRFDPVRGAKVWETNCAPLGVVHSVYSHIARVELHGDDAQVSSRASGGTFSETLSLLTGHSKDRKLDSH